MSSKLNGTGYVDRLISSWQMIPGNIVALGSYDTTQYKSGLLLMSFLQSSTNRVNFKAQQT
jgi:hypothetical protein